MKATEIRELTVKEVEERIETYEDQLLKLQMNHTISPLDNPMKISEMRKTIARMKTILTERTSQK
ncbi:MAG: 50S ribosomal protein L29 [Bacteroidales bacterium]|jgi:large subunit ribosomal protein L29|nr:50S ribosomal protein L29 [Bacteroidales bacterium]MDD4672458.1 50S ribosomal protein L29 [Bacteroidales bacterium]MDY0347267.1 50S ribosomal protein L29 [Tenuifilaceae bacterium]